MRVLVTGDRNWRDFNRVMDVFEDVLIFDMGVTLSDTTIVHGDARGADTCADHAAQHFGFELEWYPAGWKKLGPSAGPIRNSEMLKTGIDYVLGFHDFIANSRGTKDMLAKCAAAGISGRLFTTTDEVEGWEAIVSED